jgi:hypothetical protein
VGALVGTTTAVDVPPPVFQVFKELVRLNGRAEPYCMIGASWTPFPRSMVPLSVM